MPKTGLRLTQEQKGAKAAFEALIGDSAQADRAYDALEDSDRGRIISTDIVRFLDDRYAATPSGQPRDLVPSWDGAWRYAHDRFRRELEARQNRRVVRFMAGGWAAGKTHALESVVKVGHRDADLVWDGTLKDKVWAVEMIQLALDQGWKVEVFYVHRNIELALYGAIERGRREGRYVPLTKLPSNHRAVQRAIRQLISLFQRDAKVSITLVHNTGTGNIPAQAIPFEKQALARSGALHYTKRYEAYYEDAVGKIYP